MQESDGTWKQLSQDLMIQELSNISFIKSIAGLSQITTTMGYIHNATEDLRETVEKINII
jgi:hypothetical protein